MVDKPKMNSIISKIKSWFSKDGKSDLPTIERREKYTVDSGWYNIYCTRRSRAKSRKNRLAFRKAYGG